MDELELRRRLYADPQLEDSELHDALNEHPELTTLSSDLQALDSQINDALDIPIPDGLEQRLVLNQSMHAFKTQRRKTRIHLALAASIAFVCGVSFTYLNIGEPMNLGQHALAHVYHEPDALTDSSNQFSLGEVNAKLASFGANFNQLPNQVSYLTFCDFRGQRSLHMVFQTENGPMTLFVVPTHNQFEAESFFSDNEFDGATFQSKKANLILLGDKGQPLSPYGEKVKRELNWQI